MTVRLSRKRKGALLTVLTAMTLCAVVGLRSGMLTTLFAKSIETVQDESSDLVAEPILDLPRNDSVIVANGWPQLFGPTHDNISRETEIETGWSDAGPPLLWKQPLGTGYSSPVVWGDRVVVLHRVGGKEIVQCFSAADGTTLWQFRYATAYQCKFEHSSGPYSTPVLDGEHVYSLGAEGKLHCLTLDAGRPVWTRSLRDEFHAPEGIYAVGSSPLLEGDRLILNVGGTDGESGIVALDKLTGKTLWSSTKHGASYATPRAATIHNRRMVFVMTAVGLVALDPADGNVHWMIEFHPAQPDAVSAASPLVYGDIVFASAYQAGSLCVRVLPDGSYKELWRNRRNFVSQFNPLACIDGYVYGWHFFDQSFRCMELTTGKLKWKHKSQATRGTHIVVGDRMILLGEYGELASVDVNPEQAIERNISASLMASPCFSAPALSNGRLYLRNEQQILCFDLRRRSASPLATIEP